jgi:hypothetical protein
MAVITSCQAGVKRFDPVRSGAAAPVKVKALRSWLRITDQRSGDRAVPSGPDSREPRLERCEIACVGGREVETRHLAEGADGACQIEARPRIEIRQVRQGGNHVGEGAGGEGHGDFRQ